MPKTHQMLGARRALQKRINSSQVRELVYDIVTVVRERQDIVPTINLVQKMMFERLSDILTPRSGGTPKGTANIRWKKISPSATVE